MTAKTAHKAPSNKAVKALAEERDTFKAQLALREEQAATQAALIAEKDKQMQELQTAADEATSVINSLNAHLTIMRKQRDEANDRAMLLEVDLTAAQELLQALQTGQVKLVDPNAPTEAEAAEAAELEKEIEAANDDAEG